MSHENPKTIALLNAKTWYRFLKVVYFFFYAISMLIAITAFFIPDSLIVGAISFVIAFVGLSLVFELIRRVFYYILLGEFFPHGTKYKSFHLSEGTKKGLKILFQLFAVFIVLGLLVKAGDYYFNEYRPAKELAAFEAKYSIENIQFPDTAEDFALLLNEIKNSKEYDVPIHEKLSVVSLIKLAFRERHPDEWLKMSLDSTYKKDGLSFQYPSYLRVTEQDAEKFNGFYNYDGFLDEDTVYGQIVVSVLNESEKSSKCLSELEEGFSGRSWNNTLGRFNTDAEQELANAQMLKDRRDAWRGFFQGIRDGSLDISNAYSYVESYTCGSAGSNFHIKPIKVGDRNAAVIYKTISQVTESPCTYNTQVLIPKDSGDFYQIGFTYNFADFKNDCEGFSITYPEPPTPFTDITDSENRTIRTAIENNQYLDSGKFKNLFDNMRIVDAIVTTMKTE